MDIIKSVIPFDLLVDTDMGVIKYVQISYSQDYRDLFYPEIMKMIGSEHNAFLEHLLIHRSFVNPLSVLVKAQKMLVAKPDTMYEQLMEKSKDNILKLSMNTAIMEMVCKSLFLPDALRFDILCKDEKEKDELKKRFEDHFKTSKTPASIIVGTPEELNHKTYGNIYLKNIRDIKKYKQPIEGKNIIIGKYDFNKDVDPLNGDIIEVPYLDIASQYTGTNKIKFIDVYSINQSQIGVG